MSVIMLLNDVTLSGAENVFFVYLMML